MKINLQDFSISIIFLISIILFSSCTSLNNESQVPSKDATNLQVNNGNQDALNPLNNVLLPSLSVMISKVSDTYSQNEEYKMCVQSNLDMCMQQVSYKDNENISCDDYILEENKINCKNTKINNQAKESGDVSICDTLEGQKDSCKFEVITQKALEEQNESLCSELSDNYIMSCNNRVVQAIAITSGDSKICDKIMASQGLENTEKQHCIEQIKFKLEMQKNQEKQAAENKIQEEKVQKIQAIESKAREEESQKRQAAEKASIQ